MRLKIQKRLAADILKTSKSKIRFDNERLEDIKDSITKVDIRTLIKDKAIEKVSAAGPSRGRARKQSEQKAKGKRRGQGSRKGKSTARLPKKENWMNHVRKQRDLLKRLRDNKKISTAVYRDLYAKSKGGFFRSVRHIKIYMNEKGLVKE